MLSLNDLKFEEPYDIDNIDKTKIPKTCGVYIYYDINMDVMYIGKATNLRSRFGDHYNPKTSKVAMALKADKRAIKYYSYAVTEMIEDAEMYEMIYTRLKNPLLAKTSVKDIPEAIRKKYPITQINEDNVLIKDTNYLPIPDLRGDLIERKTFRLSYRICDEFILLIKTKYRMYKQQDVVSLALQEFIDKYK